MTDSSSFATIRLAEKRYHKENELSQAVAHGQLHKVESLMKNLDPHHFDRYSSDLLRNAKNSAIILNTLLRKAAEQGHVHLTSVYQLFEHYSIKIESAKSEQAILSLMKTMARKYTLLVKNHSLKGYSPMVRKVLMHIDADLTADLSLNAHAKLLHVNPSYLSNTFKKETGSTLTDYVTQKRIQYALHLLRHSNLQVQVIAQHCGISDVAYFAKLFKKFTGLTPTEYRGHALHHPHH